MADHVKEERMKQMRYAFAEENEVLCPLSGVDLRSCSEGVDLDHRFPFSKMVKDFYRKYRITPERLECKKIGTRVMIVDSNVRDLWIDYHNSHADLKLTCRKANRKKSDKII